MLQGLWVNFGGKSLVRLRVYFISDLGLSDLVVQTSHLSSDGPSLAAALLCFYLA